MANAYTGNEYYIDTAGAIWTGKTYHVNAISINVAGGAGDVHIKTGGTSGVTIFDNSNSTDMAAGTSHFLAFSSPQKMKDLYVTTLTNATITILLA